MIPNKELISLILPAEILEYFEVTNVVKEAKQMDLYLEEFVRLPDSGKQYHSKGFTDYTTIQDFPIRGKAVYLHIRRRKWLELTSGKVITNSYNLHHLGTQLSNEFAIFLKELHRR